MTEQETNLKQATELSDQPMETKSERRGRKRPSTWVHGLRHQYPAIPVRGLWDQASEEDRGRAQEKAAILLEYWLGQRTRIEAEVAMSVNPLRLWQLSNQAVAGMVAGLLTQPRSRKKVEMRMNNDEDPKKLKARILELEKMVETQKQLIAILRSMPGVREVGLGKDGTDIQSRVQKKVRSMAKKGSKGSS